MNVSNEQKCSEIVCYSQVKMTVLRDGNKFYRGTFDFCEMLDYNNNPIANAFTSMKFDGEPLMCPVPPVIQPQSIFQKKTFLIGFKERFFIFQGQNCIDQTVNTSKYINLIKIMVGQFDIKIEGTHDTVRRTWVYWFFSFIWKLWNYLVKTTDYFIWNMTFNDFDLNSFLGEILFTCYFEHQLYETTKGASKSTAQTRGYVLKY